MNNEYYTTKTGGNKMKFSNSMLNFAIAELEERDERVEKIKVKKDLTDDKK